MSSIRALTGRLRHRNIGTLSFGVATSFSALSRRSGSKPLLQRSTLKAAIDTGRSNFQIRTAVARQERRTSRFQGIRFRRSNSLISDLNEPHSFEPSASMLVEGLAVQPKLQILPLVEYKYGYSLFAAIEGNIKMVRPKATVLILLLATLLGCAGISGASFAATLGTWRHGDIEGDAFICVPKGEPPFPAVVLNHGRYIDDRGLAAARQKGYNPEGLCEAFARDGYLALLPIRRNRSDMKAALREVMAAVGAVRARPDVDRNRVTLGGHSRGGLLSFLAAIRGAPVRSYMLFAPAPGGRGKLAKLPDVVGRVDAPVLVMFERSDKFHEIREVVDRLEEAFRAAGTPHKVIRYDRGGGHDLFLAPGYYWPDMMSFLRNPPGRDRR